MKKNEYKVLWIELTHRQISEEVIEEDKLRQYLGGYGLGARILIDHIPPDSDPLDAENVLGFVTGVLSGTPAVGGSRYVVVGKSPLTGEIGRAHV